MAGDWASGKGCALPCCRQPGSRLFAAAANSQHLRATSKQTVKHTCSTGSAMSASGVLVPAAGPEGWAACSPQATGQGFACIVPAPAAKHMRLHCAQYCCFRTQPYLPAMSRKIAAWSRRRKKTRALGCHVGRWYSADAPNMAVVLRQWCSNGAERWCCGNDAAVEQSQCCAAYSTDRTAASRLSSTRRSSKAASRPHAAPDCVHHASPGRLGRLRIQHQHDADSESHKHGVVVDRAPQPSFGRRVRGVRWLPGGGRSRAVLSARRATLLRRHLVGISGRHLGLRPATLGWEGEAD